MNKFSSLLSSLAVLNDLVPAVVAAPPMYPFVGQKACKAKLETETSVQLCMMVTLLHLQTDQEQAIRDTKEKNKRGFMSSHAKHGTAVAEKIRDGKDLTADDWAVIAKVAPHYSRQMAVSLRTFAMANDPALAITAAGFSAA